MFKKAVAALLFATVSANQLADFEDSAASMSFENDVEFEEDLTDMVLKQYPALYKPDGNAK